MIKSKRNGSLPLVGLSILMTSSLLMTTACAPKEEEQQDATETSLEESAESAIAAVSGLIDDHAQTSGFAVLSRPSKYQALMEVLSSQVMAKAQADACLRAASQACNTGVKSINYSMCDVASSILKIDDGDANPSTPSVKMQYSANDCSLDSAGESVARTYDYKVVGPRGGTLRISSEPLENSADGVFGGGQLTNNGGGTWTAKLLGRNSTLTGPNGRVLFNHSVQTVQDVVVQNTLSRNGRLLANGAVKVYHNLAGFQVTHSVKDLQFSAACCYPVSGTVSSFAEGSINKSYSVEFTGCGSATLTDNQGKTRDFQFSYCE